MEGEKPFKFGKHSAILNVSEIFKCSLISQKLRLTTDFFEFTDLSEIPYDKDTKYSDQEKQNLNSEKKIG